MVGFLGEQERANEQLSKEVWEEILVMSETLPWSQDFINNHL